MASESDHPWLQSVWDIVSPDLPRLETDAKSDEEPDPKRVKLDEEGGWDRWRETDYLIYSDILMKSVTGDDVLELLQFLENHVMINRGFDIDVCPPACIDTFISLVLPPGAPISEELKDFPRIHPTCAEECLQETYALAKYAVEFQNEKKNSKLEFVKVLKAYTFEYIGSYNYITLVAFDKGTSAYRKCQTRVYTSLWSSPPVISYGVDSFWVKERVDAALAATPEVPQSWPSCWELTRLREDEMHVPRV